MTAYQIAVRMIDGAETVDDLMATKDAFDVGAFSKTEDAELTRLFQEKWASLRKQAREDANG
jgi:hypothetical protein